MQLLAELLTELDQAGQRFKYSYNTADEAGEAQKHEGVVTGRNMGEARRALTDRLRKAQTKFTSLMVKPMSDAEYDAWQRMKR